MTKRKYTKYTLKKIYFKSMEVRKRLGVSAHILKRESKKLFPHKWEGYENGKKMKYNETEIEALRLSLQNSKDSKAIAKQVTFKNPDHLFDGFAEIVDMQG